MLAGPDLYLLGPRQFGQQFRNIQRIRPEGWYLTVEPRNVIHSHPVEADGAGGDRTRMTVLHPKNDFFTVRRRRQACIPIGRPGIGVVRTRQHIRCIAVSIECIFDHVMARRIYRMQEQLARKGAETKPSAHFLAVEYHGAHTHGQVLTPLRQNSSVGIEQAAPHPNIFCTVTRPVICGDDACMMAVLVAEKGKISREIDRVEIQLRRRQHIVVQSH